jgi:hypothetical protein
MPGERIVVLLGLMGVAACAGPSLDLPSESGPQVSSTVELDPAIEPDGVALNFRGRLRHAPVVGQPWLFHGELTDYYDRALRRGDVPAALRERAVPLRYWRDADDCWMQPVVWLEPDVTYTLAFEGTGKLRTLQARVGAGPRATRLFPAPGRSKHRVAVVCDMAPASQVEPTTLEPGGVALQQLVKMAGLPRPGCLTLSAVSDVAAPTVSRPVLGGMLIDPAPWLPRQKPSVERAAPCADQELGGACLEVLDDRLFITPRAEDQLWLLDVPTSAAVTASAGSRTALIGGLAPDSSFRLHASVLSSDGRLELVEASVTTSRARRHVVLNEVLANPLGDESTGEWIELVNDSERPASLEGLWLEDTGGHVALPDVVLAPGELALLVNEDFRPSSLDVAVPAGVRLVQLPSLGTRGLGNGGEPLLLVGPEGTLSRFPQLAPSHAGHSVARRFIDAADDAGAAFSEHGSPGASPGAPNWFDAPND